VRRTAETYGAKDHSPVLSADHAGRQPGDARKFRLGGHEQPAPLFGDGVIRQVIIVATQKAGPSVRPDPTFCCATTQMS